MYVGRDKLEGDLFVCKSLLEVIRALIVESMKVWCVFIFLECIKDRLICVGDCLLVHVFEGGSMN